MTKRKHKKPEIVEVPEPAYRQPEPDVIVVDRVEAGDRALETARMSDFLESEDFYDVMQTYRHMPVGQQSKVAEAFEAVKKLIQLAMNALVEPLKDECDRDWKDETPEQVVAIAANAIYWRGKARESAMNAQERELREALESLVSQLQKCHADQRYQSVWQLYAIHGGQYTGPFYREQLAEAERLLAERGEAH